MPPPASNPDLWSFNLETAMQVSPKVGNFPSKFGHAKIMYATDGRTEATLIAPFPTVGGYTQRLQND